MKNINKNINKIKSNDKNKYNRVRKHRYASTAQSQKIKTAQMGVRD